MYEKKRRLTISLLSFTFLFLIMTLPDSIYYGFFESKDEYLNQNIGGAQYFASQIKIQSIV